MGKRAKKIEWPVELRQPFPSFSQLTERARLLKPGGSLAEVIGVEFFAEVKRRVIAMVGFVDPLTEGPPATEREWLRFIYYLSLYCGIPGFQEAGRRKAGRPKKWTDEKRLQLFADVMSLVQRRRMTEHSACLYIASHPEHYLDRHPNDPKTLHREFQRAKNAFEDNRVPFLTRAEEIQLLIDRYSAAAEKERQQPHRGAE